MYYNDTINTVKGTSEFNEGQNGRTYCGRPILPFVYKKSVLLFKCFDMYQNSPKFVKLLRWRIRKQQLYLFPFQRYPTPQTVRR